MATKKKLLEAAAGAAGGAGGLNVEDVFSTYLYDGTGSAQTITNGIDLSGEGGLVWSKNRGLAEDHCLVDTIRGGTKELLSSATNAEGTAGNISAFNSDGYSFAGNGRGNYNGYNYASWTFRKAPKFFDVVTYTGDGVAGRTISHNLGSTPGMIIVKSTSNAYNWCVYHSGILASDPNGIMVLNSTNASSFYNGQYFFGNDTGNVIQPTDSVFTVGSNAGTNGLGATYVAYLFAHNNGDGDFGPNGDQDIIKCGSYTGTGSLQHVDLGWEPQYILIKNASSDAKWIVHDVMRGLSKTRSTFLVPNATDVDFTPEDYSQHWIDVDATGFNLEYGAGYTNFSGDTYIYIAIRRGPMAVPESATEVFAMDYNTGSAPSYISNFPVDFMINKNPSGGSNKAYARLLGAKLMYTNATNAETSDPAVVFDYMNGAINNANDTGHFAWMWKRAPSFMDVVAYTGNGTWPRNITHNLGVAPEMMWIKPRDLTGHWLVYHSGLNVDGDNAPETDYIILNSTAAAVDSATLWNDTAPTDTVFTLGSTTGVNASGYNYIAYLFASLDGVSKVGSYTGNGSTQNIDCGFSSGARFVLIKRTNDIGSWWVFDTERGIVAGSDAYLKLNDTAAEGSAQAVNPYSGGFGVDASGLSSINGNGDTFIFYAIA